MADNNECQTPKVFSIFQKPTTIKEIPSAKKQSEIERKRKYEKDARQRKFQATWLKEFEWLVYDDKSCTMRCKICNKFETVGSFVTGTNFFRKDSIKAHEDSNSHCMNVKKEKSKLDPENSEAVKALSKLNEKTISQLKIKFRNVHYLSKKCRPFTDYVELCHLNKAHNLDIGTTYLSNRSATEFMGYIAEARERIRKNIVESKFISVISDGSTDASYQEAEIVYVRTCNKGKVEVYFSLIKNVSRGDAETICGVMQDELKNLSVNYKDKLVGTGTDGASTMLGAKTGAVQRLREAVNRPFIVVVHCNGHKLELSFKDSIKTEIPLYNKVELFLTNLYYFYRNSNVSRSGLKESSKAVGKKMVYPTRVSGTRWVGHLKIAIENFLKGYDMFVTHLGQLQNRDVSVSRTEKGNKAKGFYACAKTKSVWLMLHFLLDVLEVLSSVSKKFQSQTACVSEVLTEIEMAVVSLEKMKERNGLKLRQAMELLPCDLTGDDRSFISARHKLLTSIVESLHRRFTDNPGILASVSTFNLSLFPSDAKDLIDYGDDDVDQLVDHFSTALEDGGVDINQIAHEWTKLKQLMPARFTSPINNITWVDVNSKLGKVCPNVLALVDLVHTIPASSADVERGFSYLKNTKSASRNKLLDTNLSNQLMVVLETAPVNEYDPTEAVHLWNAAVLRRPRQETRSKLSPLQLEDRTGEAVKSGDRVIKATEESDGLMVVTSESENEEQMCTVTDFVDNLTCEQESIFFENSSVSEVIDVPDKQSIKNKVDNKSSDLIEGESDRTKEVNNNSDMNNNESNLQIYEKQEKKVGSDTPIPVFSSKATQTESNIDIVMDEEVEESYYSDCDFYDNEYDESQFEKSLDYKDRCE